MPDTNLLAAAKTAERLRLLVQNNPALNKLTTTGLTISAGLSAFDVTQSMDWHISMADKQLYKAKESGRNCIVY